MYAIENCRINKKKEEYQMKEFIFTMSDKYLNENTVRYLSDFDEIIYIDDIFGEELNEDVILEYRTRLTNIMDFNSAMLRDFDGHHANTDEEMLAVIRACVDAYEKALTGDFECEDVDADTVQVFLN